MNVEGGAAMPIHITTNAPIAGPALPVYLYTPATLGDRHIESGITSVYLVSDAELAAGTFKLQGNVTAIPVIDYTSADTSIPDVHPIPVYITNSIPTPPVVLPWYLAGGVNPSDCVAAYQAKGVADYATSKLNLSNPGIHDLTESAAVTWNSLTGWSFGSNGRYLITDIVLSDLGNASAYSIMRYSSWLSSPLNRAPFGSDYIDDVDYEHDSAFELRRIGGTFPNYIVPPESGTGTNIYGKLYTERAGVLIPADGVACYGCDNKLYIDGLITSSPNVDIDTTPSANIGEPVFYIGNVHYKDYYDDVVLYSVPGTEASINILAIAFYKNILTASQVLAITAAMQAL